MSEFLFLNPVFKQTIWGGDKLSLNYGFHCEAGTGECWAISAHENGMGTIATGRYKGKTLEWVWKEHPEMFGNEDGRFGEKFPLLIKIIDAAEDLSIQVHPDDGYAKEHAGGSLGKMECWYVLDCKENASIIIGHNAKDEAQMKELIKQKQWGKFLREIPVKKGDFFQINPGCVHAVKGGTVILETQQSSDITYRVYDYDRLQNGKPRELHIKDSEAVIRTPFVSAADERKKLKTYNVDIEHLIKCEKYSVERYSVHGEWIHSFRAPFTNVTVTEGEGSIDGKPVHKGVSLIIPKGCGALKLAGEFTVICSWAECADKKEKTEHCISVEDWMGRQKAKIRVDDTMDEAMVYLTKKELTFDIPFEEKTKLYNKNKERN